MRKLFLTGLVLIMSLLMAVPAFASEARKQYREEKAEINAQIQAVNDEIKAIKAQNKEIREKFTGIRQTKKDTGVLPISKEAFTQARELKKTVTDIEIDPDAEAVKAERAKVKEYAAAEDFESAKECLRNVLAMRLSQLECQKQRNAVWLQIDALISE